MCIFLNVNFNTYVPSYSTFFTLKILIGSIKLSVHLTKNSMYTVIGGTIYNNKRRFSRLISVKNKKTLQKTFEKKNNRPFSSTNNINYIT